LIPKLYESLEKIPAITSPTLLLHGGRDQLVPLSQGEKLFEAMTAPKSMHVFPSAGHNDISTQPKYHEVILRFLADPGSYADDQLTLI
jgi:pimeloyl-ACP methyl ester carboxylesterase